MSDWLADYYATKVDERDDEILRLRAEVRLFEIVVCETAKALGVVPDNDAIIEGIESLRAENEKLRAALEPFAELALHTGSMSNSDGVCVYVGDLRAARAALKETGDE